MPFTNVWTNNNNPPDSEAANLMYLEVRKLRQDVADRISALTCSSIVADPPQFETQFAGIICIDMSTGRIYQFSGGGFNDITNEILSNIGLMPASGLYSLTLPPGVTIYSPNILPAGPAGNPDPGGIATYAPPAGYVAGIDVVPNQLATCGLVQAMLRNVVGNYAATQVAIKVPLTWAAGVPTAYVCFRAGSSSLTGNGQLVSFNDTGFSSTPFVSATPLTAGSAGTGSCNIYDVTTAQFNYNSGDSATGINWTAMGIST